MIYLFIVEMFRLQNLKSGGFRGNFSPDKQHNPRRPISINFLYQLKKFCIYSSSNEGKKRPQNKRLWLNVWGQQIFFSYKTQRHFMKYKRKPREKLISKNLENDGTRSRIKVKDVLVFSSNSYLTERTLYARRVSPAGWLVQ